MGARLPWSIRDRILVAGRRFLSAPLRMSIVPRGSSAYFGSECDTRVGELKRCSEPWEGESTLDWINLMHLSSVAQADQGLPATEVVGGVLGPEIDLAMSLSQSTRTRYAVESSHEDLTTPRAQTRRLLRTRPLRNSRTVTPNKAITALNMLPQRTNALRPRCVCDENSEERVVAAHMNSQTLHRCSTPVVWNALSHSKSGPHPRRYDRMACFDALSLTGCATSR